MTTPSPARRSVAAYGLPLSQRRHGTAVLLSLLAHTTIAVAVLWRGAALFHGGGAAGPRGGGGGGERGGPPAVSWFALPAPSGPRAQDVPAVPAAPAVSVPVLALPPPAVDIDIPLLPPAPLPVAAGPGVGEGTAAGQGSGTGGGRGTGAGTGSGADRGPGSGGAAGYIFPASPRWSLLPPPGAPRQDRGQHEVRFWVSADGHVTRVAVTPPIQDANYRREFMKKMMGFVFDPARTPDGRAVASIASVTITF